MPFPANKSYITGKPQKSLKGHCRDNEDSRGRGVGEIRLNKSHPVRNPAKDLAKHRHQKNRHDDERDLTVSLRKLSLGIQIPIAQSITRKTDIVQFIHRNLMAWTEKVFVEVGPGQKEKSYHIKLKNLLLSKGLDVGYEVPLRFERLGSKPVVRRVDLIVSMSGIPQKVLIECKAKKKLEKKDFKQVIFYRHHFGISDCYLINFRADVEVKRLKQTENA